MVGEAKGFLALAEDLVGFFQDEPKSLKILDETGRTVHVFDLPRNQGNRFGKKVEVTWQGRDERGKSLPSGIYFVILTDQYNQIATETL